MSMNSYNEILHFLNLDSIYYSRSTLGGCDWGIGLPEFEGTSMFHIATSGSCLVEINDNSIELKAGDLVFISRACGHNVIGSKDAEIHDLFSLPVQQIGEHYETLEINPEVKEKTTLLCGVVKISHPAGEMLLSEMPDLIHVKQEQHMFGDMMGEIVRLVLREASGEYIGGETVITRLADVLLIQAIRSWVEDIGDDECRWLSALKDRKIGKAMLAIHNSPEINWTIESLGKEVGLSRTAFSNRFNELVGETVMSYLTKWRMNLAQMRIKSGEIVNLDFVESLGYKSESAFRRTFRKTLGLNVSEIKKMNASII
ncbi:MAG: AraC family transcriptional regulator [Pseudomonadota bacterium]